MISCITLIMLILYDVKLLMYIILTSYHCFSLLWWPRPTIWCPLGPAITALLRIIRPDPRFHRSTTNSTHNHGHYVRPASYVRPPGLGQSSSLTPSPMPWLAVTVHWCPPAHSTRPLSRYPTATGQNGNDSSQFIIHLTIWGDMMPLV